MYVCMYVFRSLRRLFDPSSPPTILLCFDPFLLGFLLFPDSTLYTFLPAALYSSLLPVDLRWDRSRVLGDINYKLLILVVLKNVISEKFKLKPC